MACREFDLPVLFSPMMQVLTSDTGTSRYAQEQTLKSVPKLW
jgi:hypothetical protein